MVVKVFCGEKSKFEHELNQLEELHNLINNEYAKKDDVIYILTNFRLSNTEIDVLVLTEKGLAIIDLKSYEGEIKGSETGEWKVITKNGDVVPLKDNLFDQFVEKRSALKRKLFRVQEAGNFEHIEGKLLSRISSWGYFKKGSTYDLKQVDDGVHIWFDVITADKLIRKIGLLNAGYKLQQEDMDAIVKGLNLKSYSFEKPPIQEDSTFESNWNKELSVFIEPQNWNKILSKIKDSNIITVVGDRNVGKTTTIMNLANELKKSGYRVHEDKESLIRLFTSREEKDRKEYYNLINNKNIFILDDLFGKTEYEPSLGNKWVYLIIDILDSAVNQSKIIIGSRRDVIDDFFSNNNELSRWGLFNEFKNSMIDLKFSDYDERTRNEIFDKNMNFIHLDEKNKAEILNRNKEKITKELLLPGDISYFIQKAKEKVDFHESELDSDIDKAKKQINSIATDIKKLTDYEKTFLYNLFINQNFSIEDFEVVYLHCLPQGLTNRDYFAECIENLEGKFIRNTIEIRFLTDKKYKLEFIHDVYKEAIEKLINTEQVERRRIEEILRKLHGLIRLQSIDEWNTNNSKLSILGGSNYDTIKFNIYKVALRNYRVFNIQDLVFEILDSLSFGHLFLPVTYDPEMEMHESLDDESSKFLTELFNNRDKLVEETNYFNELFKKEEYKVNIAYCFAYRLDHTIVNKFQDKLKELSKGNVKVKHLLAKCIIRNYEFLNEDNRKLLYNLGVKPTLLIQFLMHNYTIISNELKNTLEKQIAATDKAELIETSKTFLLNYISLPEEIKRYYEFIFDLKDERVIKQVGEAFGDWFNLAFTEFHDPKRESLDEKILNLYCKLLEDKEIVLKNYESIHLLYGEAEPIGLEGDIENSIRNYEFLHLAKPGWTEPFYHKLRVALIKNMMILLDSFPSKLNKDEFPSIKEKTMVYNIALIFYSWCENKELIEKVNNILYESDDLKFIFLEEYLNSICNINQPFNISIPQIDIIDKLSKPPNHPSIKAKANEVLNHMKDLMDKKNCQCH